MSEQVTMTTIAKAAASSEGHDEAVRVRKHDKGQINPNPKITQAAKR